MNNFGFVVDLIASDFNGDGNVDLAVVDAMFSGIDIFLGNGTGQFTKTSTVIAGGLSCLDRRR